MTIGTIELNRYLHQKKPLWNVLSILYTLVGYLGGITLLLLPNGWLNALGVFFVTHSLICSAYLAHDFMHSALFESKALNVAFGNLMLWLNGGCYARFADLARLHIAHHVNRVDFCRFDLTAFLNAIPAPVRWLLLALEWLYFPSLAFVLRIRSIFAPFWEPDRKDERLRNVLILIIRGGLFALLGVVSPKALLLYFVSYIGMVTVLRFVDAFQHTYEVFPLGSVIPRRDRAHEQANTFSNVVSLRYWWLNLLLLNFGYHNAHHELMKCPWYNLHELDRDLFNGDEVQYITLPELLGNYHRYRISRLYSGQGRGIDEQGNRSLETFYGAIEVSFLVLPA
ncbi:MAG: fatty acid desaturase [Leptolyngbya sp. BL-A-14]